MIALLLVGLLGSPSLWVERDATVLHLSADLGPLFDAPLRRRLKSGLTTRLRMDVRLVEVETGVERGHTWRSARARWDLWDEALTVVVDESSGGYTLPKVTIDAFVARFARVTGPIARGVPRNAAVYRVEVTVAVNPTTQEQMERMRQWLSLPGPTTKLDPLSGSLLGSFVRLFDNLKPGAAERTIYHAGQAFRGDRLPFRKAP